MRIEVDGADMFFKYGAMAALVITLFRFVVPDLIVAVRKAFAEDVTKKEDGNEG